MSIYTDHIKTHEVFPNNWKRDATNGYIYPKTLTDKVGIGKNDPAYALDVVGWIRASENIYATGGYVRSDSLIWASGGATGEKTVARYENWNDDATGVKFATKLSGSEFSALLWLKDSAWVSGDADAGKDVSLYLRTLDDNVQYTAMAIKANGYVGIGNTGPFYRTMITETHDGARTVPLCLQNKSTTTDTAVSLLLATTSDPLANTNGRISFESTRQADGSNDLSVKLSPGSAVAPIERLFIDGSLGRVGIGTATPATELDLVGDFQATGTGSFGGVLDMNSHQINEVADPTLDQDAATKKYADDNDFWERDATNGYIYPSTLTDKVGIGKDDPTTELDVNGDATVQDRDVLRYSLLNS